MAIITIKEGASYACRFYYIDSFGKQQRVYKSEDNNGNKFRTKKEAKKFEMEEKERLKGTNANDKITLVSFVDEFFIPSRIEKNVSIATLQKYEYYIPRIKKDLGHLVFSKINENHCQAFINQFTASTQNEQRKILTSIFNYGIFKRIIRENPMKFINFREYKSKKVPPYDFSDCNDLLTTLKKDKRYCNLYPAAILAFFFAASREEVTALLETDLNYNDYSIKLDKAYITALKQKIVTKQKTYYRNRIDYGNKTIFNELNWYKKTFNISSPFVCCNRDGTRMQPNTLTNRFSDFIKTRKLKYITFHKIRNTHSTLSKRAGIDSDTIFRKMGHANYKTTVEHYNSPDSTLLREASQTLANNVFKLELKNTNKKDVL